MKNFALIGTPLSGSLSPCLMKAAYNGRYRYDLLDSPDFDLVWGRFLKDYNGINVTAPFKEKAFHEVLHSGKVSPNAEISGAVNLVVKTPGGLYGHNCDVDGILSAITPAVDALGTAGKKPRALVVGAGGAGRAAITAAFLAGMDVTLVNRTYEKAVALSEEMEQLWFSVNPMEDLRECIRGADLVIYTLPCPVPGLKKEDFQGKWVLEANYKTPCLKDFFTGKEKSGGYISGLEWLLGQAAAGYTLFTGEEPDVTAMRSQLKTRRA